MDDTKNLCPPKYLLAIEADTRKIEFKMASEPLVGSLLRTLAASKAKGRFLELGTGTGLSTAWLLVFHVRIRNGGGFVGGSRGLGGFNGFPVFHGD